MKYQAMWKTLKLSLKEFNQVVQISKDTLMEYMDIIEKEFELHGELVDSEWIREHYQVSRATLQRHRTTGKLPYVKKDKHQYKHEDVITWQKKNGIRLK